jgi:hypothetical protein
MSDHDNTPPEMQRLALFVGDWTLAAGFGGEPPGEQEPGEEWRKDFDLIYRRVD